MEDNGDSASDTVVLRLCCQFASARGLCLLPLLRLMANIVLWTLPSHWLTADKTRLLPLEIFTAILDLSSRRTIRRASLVSRHWRNAALAHTQYCRPVTLTCGTGSNSTHTADYDAVQLALVHFAQLATPLKLELRIFNDATAHISKVTKIATELARTMHIVKFLRICTVSPSVFDRLLRAATATSAPLLRELFLAYQAPGYSGYSIDWPVNLFSGDSPRLRVLVLSGGVQPPTAPVQALQQVRSVTILQGTARYLDLQLTMPRARRLDLNLRALFEAEVDDFPSNTRALSFPTKLIQLNASITPMHGSPTAAAIRATSHVIQAVLAAAPTSNINHMCLPIPTTHPEDPFDPKRAFVGLPSRISVRVTEERNFGWPGRHHCIILITGAETNDQAVVREFHGESTSLAEDNRLSPSLLLPLITYHDLVLLEVEHDLLPQHLCISLIFPALEQFEIRLSARACKTSSLWPLLREQDPPTPRPCRPDGTEEISTARMPQLKVLWLHHHRSFKTAEVAHDPWQDGDNDISTEAPNSCPLTCSLDCSGIEDLAGELGLKLLQDGQKPDLWLTNVLITQSESSEGSLTGVFCAVKNKVRR